NRRQVVKMLLLGTVLTPAAITGYQLSSAAGYSTIAGQRRQFPLPDGSILTLNSSSSADVQSTAQGIMIELHSGDAHVSTVAKSLGGQPVQVRTAGWELTLAQGEYLFHQR